MIHGTIGINSREIASWAAVRDREEGPDSAVYKVHVTLNKTVVRFELTHRPSAGALALVSRIMDEADFRMALAGVRASQ